MSFSYFKTFSKTMTISSKNLRCSQSIGLRLYCKKIIISSSSPQEIVVTSKMTHKSIDDSETKQLFHYTHTPELRRDPYQNTSMVRHKELNKLEPSKYFKPKTKPKKNSRSNLELEPGEIYPEGEIDESEYVDDKKPYQRVTESHNRVNHKLLEDPKYKVEYTRNNEVENYEDCEDLSDLRKEILDFSNNEEQLKTNNESVNNSKENLKIDLTLDEFNITEFVNKLNDTPTGPLDECKENLSDLGSDFSPTFNFAAYADYSKLIQAFTNLGVKLYKVEKNQDHMRALLTVDLEKELPAYLQFLHDCGVPADSLGDVITENPMILKEDLDDMKTRIRYLRAHDFSVSSIARIVTKNPSWLVWATKYIDERLGHFQNEFKLTGREIRFLATKQPKLITYSNKHIQENTFAVKELMGFNVYETKLLLLGKPRLWMNSRRKIVESFDYLHNTMKLSHYMLVTQSEVLTTRKSRIKNRHEFLVELKKAQYNPKKTGYIAPRSIVVGSDEEFCQKVAKTAVDTFNLFLKTR